MIGLQLQSLTIVCFRFGEALLFGGQVAQVIPMGWLLWLQLQGGMQMRFCFGKALPLQQQGGQIAMQLWLGRLALQGCAVGLFCFWPTSLLLVEKAKIGQGIGKIGIEL